MGVRRRRSPNFAGFFAHHGVGLGATESASEVRHVRERSVASEARQWMRIGVGHQARVFQAFVRAPDLRPPEKKLLLGRESVFLRRAWFTFQRFFLGGLPNRQPATARNTFPTPHPPLLLQHPSNPTT